MARERINGYLHPDVMRFLEELAVTHKFRSVMPAIELIAKEVTGPRLLHVHPGAYDKQKTQDEIELKAKEDAIYRCRP